MAASGASLPCTARTPSCTKERKSFTDAAPIQRPTTCSPFGSMMRNVGQASSGKRSRNALFFSFSPSMDSHTTASFTGRIPASGKT